MKLRNNYQSFQISGSEHLLNSFQQTRQSHAVLNLGLTDDSLLDGIDLSNGLLGQFSSSIH